MTIRAARQPRLLSQMNERSVLRVLQSHGPCSRAEVTRRLGVTAPTVSKAVASLLRSGLLEEFESSETGRGRPAKRLRLAVETAQVLGLVIDAGECRLVAAGLDGVLRSETECRFPTPDSYEGLIERVVERAQPLCERRGVETLGLGISMPGLIDYRQSRGMLSPNVPITNGQTPSLDLGHRLKLKTVLVQETHALCLAERIYGLAGGLDDFAMLDATTGVGLGVFTNGRLLTGRSGLAGEIGHLPVQAKGRRCGCGRVGCLETVASDSALAWAVSRRLGKPLDLDQIARRIRSGDLQVSRELRQTCRQLAFALTTVINLFNPSTLFIHSRLFDLDDSLWERVLDETRRRAMVPSLDDCRIVRARGSKREGAVAGIIQHLTDSRVPAEGLNPASLAASGSQDSSAAALPDSDDDSGLAADRLPSHDHADHPSQPALQPAISGN